MVKSFSTPYGSNPLGSVTSARQVNRPIQCLRGPTALQETVPGRDP